MAFPLTEEQKHVVDDRGGELLVSAAAGSGKTRVLVERLLDRITREGWDIDDFLVITYTRAAAAELRERVARELSQRLAQDPGDRHLRRQTTLVYRAQISTVHAFCADLLRESGHLIDLNGDFRLCDEGEATVLKAQALTDLLEERYEGLEPGGAFACLVDTLSAGRDDSRLEQIVLDIHGRIQSHPDPTAWLEEQRRLWRLEGVTDAGETPWGALLLRDAEDQAAYWAGRLARALELSGGDEVLSANYGPTLSATLAGLEAFRAAARTGWDAAQAALPIPFPAAGRKRGTQDLELARRVKGLREAAKKQLEKLSGLFSGDSAALLADMASTAPAVDALMELVEDFQARYQKVKERRGVLDFSDLEHLALRVLVGEDGSPTAAAEHCQRRFAEVMVDEYQDTNQVQNAIFQALSQGGRRLFMVGDVKQSIYRFRLADPTIFLEKYRRFPMWDQAKDGEGRKIVLSRNFRSRAQVLEGCNDLFRAILSRELGEIDYTPDQALYPGAEYPEGGYPVELLAVDLSFQGEDAQEREDKNRIEARCAARRIRALLDQGLLVGQGEERRPLQPSDVMLLLRSPGPVLPHYIRALEEEDIPWNAQGGEDCFDTTEVHVALSILQIVDNPRQDVPLIAALRSPVYGFTAEDLSRLRAASKGDFYQALTEAAQAGDQACARFLEELEKLRRGAGERTCRELIWHIYQHTNLLGIFGAMEGGERRQENLLALYALAGQLEDGGCRSLFSFLVRLERLRASGELTPPPGGGRGSGGVSIMSIHRSKGLEKPVVLVCGLSRQFNRDDMKRPVLFHPSLGVGPRGLDRERMLEYPTLARQAVEHQLLQESMAEEMRLLYVAMTRAREKLILTMTLAQGGRQIQSLGEDVDFPVSPMALRRQNCPGAWVLLHALSRPEGEPLRSLGELDDPPPIPGLGPAWDIRVVDGAELEGREGAARPAPEQPGRGLSIPREELREALNWRYPYEGATQTPSKLTATQLKGREVDREAAQEAAGLVGRQVAPVTRPDFAAREMGLTAAQRGTALHLAMQYLPLDCPPQEEAVAWEIGRLVADGFLTPLQGAAASAAPLAAFLASPLGRQAARAQEEGKCRREFKFSVLLPAAEFCPGVEEGEEVMLQGVIDCWFETQAGITLLDFKSDRIPPGHEGERGEHYRGQLMAYSRALEEITGRPVTRRCLWFFATGQAWDLP